MKGSQFKARCVLFAGIALAAAAPVLAAEAMLDLSGSSAASSAGTIEVQSFSWGVHNAGTSSCPSSSDKGRWMAPEAPSSKGGRSSSSSSSGAPPAAACVSVVTAREAGSGMATGRRKGWDGCVKGARLGAVGLVHRDLAYRMTGAVVEECTADGMVLSYEKITWDRVPRATLTVSGSN
jgi:hypothetical protein